MAEGAGSGAVKPWTSTSGGKVGRIISTQPSVMDLVEFGLTTRMWIILDAVILTCPIGRDLNRSTDWTGLVSLYQSIKDSGAGHPDIEFLSSNDRVMALTLVAE